MFEAVLGRFSTLMRGLEVLGVYTYFAIFVLSLHHYSFWMFELTIVSLEKFLGTGFDKKMEIIMQYEQPVCLKNHKVVSEWGGGILQWIQCEISFHIAYMLTFVFLMIKSRFTTVGTDNTK